MRPTGEEHGEGEQEQDHATSFELTAGKRECHRECDQHVDDGADHGVDDGVLVTGPDSRIIKDLGITREVDPLREEGDPPWETSDALEKLAITMNHSG